MSSTSLQSTSTPDSIPGVTETVYVKALPPEQSESADSTLTPADWLGAIVRTSYLCGDALFVSRESAASVSTLWSGQSANAENVPTERIGSVVDDPVVVVNARTGLEETAALASHGVRCTFVGEDTDIGPDHDSGARVTGTSAATPFVVCSVGRSPTADRPSDTMLGFVVSLTGRFANAQEASDLLIIANALSELSLCPCVVRFENDFNKFVFGATRFATGEQLRSLVGSPSDLIDTPTEYQRELFGPKRRRIPIRPEGDFETAILRRDAGYLLEQVLARFADLTGRSYSLSDQSGEAEKPVHKDPSSPVFGIRSARPLTLARQLAADLVGAGVESATVSHGSSKGNAFLSVTSMEKQPGTADGSVMALIVGGARRHGLAGEINALADGSAVVIDHAADGPELIWQSLSESIRNVIREKSIRIFAFNAPEEGEDGRRARLFEESVVRLIISRFLSVSAVDQATGRFSADVFRDPSGSVKTNGEVESMEVGNLDVPDMVELLWNDYEVSTDFYPKDRNLRIPTGAVEPGGSDVALQQMLAFHNHGAVAGRSICDSGFIPLSLYPYLNAPAQRTPYPFCLITKGAGVAVSLSSIVDGMIVRNGAAGTSVDQTKELLKVEAGITRLAEDHPDRLLTELWDLASGFAVGSDATSREGLAVDGGLLGCSPASHATLIDHAHGLHWSTDFDSMRKVVDELVVQIDELLRRDFSESSEGSAPDHLAASVGKAFADELDFDALSEIIGETDHGDGLSERRRSRLESVAADLRQLPRQLAAARSPGVIVGDEGLFEVVALVRRDRRVVTALAKAVRIAQLEVTGKYAEDRHDPVFARFSFEHVAPDEAALCPPYVVRLKGSSLSSQLHRGELLDILASDMPIKVLLSINNIPTGTSGLTDDGARYAVAAGLAMQAVSLGTAYVVQSSASELDTILQAAEQGTRWQGPSLFSIYAGSDTSIDALDSYLTSAIALESRAFPTFEFDPSKREWADQFTVSHNPQVELPWGQEDFEVGNGHEQQGMAVSFTFADFLACDQRYREEFRAVPAESWHSDMHLLDKYLTLDPAASSAKALPFVWMADETGVLHRVIVTNKVVEATKHVLKRWRLLQELGGVTSSHAARLVKEATERLELEKLEAIEQAKQQHQKDLDRTTGEVARDIVSNIAAGLLGLQATAPRAMTSGEPGVAVRVVTEAPEEAVVPADPADGAEPAPEEDDDDVISMDEAYIETVRCTTCNECTNINPRMFAYNENQQAYIKDVTAGSFHELVASAELCPVKIIHPGKPLNPDEPRLSDLIERAKPYQ